MTRKKIDVAQLEHELLTLSLRINEFLMAHPTARVFEVEGELDISHEEFLAAAAYHQRMYHGIRAAQMEQMRRKGIQDAEKGERS